MSDERVPTRYVIYTGDDAMTLHHCGFEEATSRDGALARFWQRTTADLGEREALWFAFPVRSAQPTRRRLRVEADLEHPDLDDLLAPPAEFAAPTLNDAAGSVEVDPARIAAALAQAALAQAPSVR